MNRRRFGLSVTSGSGAAPPEARPPTNDAANFGEAPPLRSVSLRETELPSSFSPKFASPGPIPSLSLSGTFILHATSSPSLESNFYQARCLIIIGTEGGGPLSPLLSNVVLDELDWELERRGLCFVRYADDCNIYVDSERACQRVMDSVRRFLEGRLRLLVNEDKSAVARPEERHFLGFRLRRNPDGQVEVHLSQRTVERLKLRIGELTPRSWGQSLKTCFEGLNEYLRGWFAYFRICTQTGADLFRVFDAHIRRRIRAIIIHQKRRNRFLLRALLARGVSRRAATGTAWSRRGTWHRSNRPGMTRAYPNPWFRARLFSLSDAWLRLHAVQLVSGQLSLFDHEELIPKSRM